MSGTLILRFIYIKITKRPKNKLTIISLSHIRNGKVKQRTLMSFGKADDNCIPINEIKRVTVGISDTFKNGKKRIWVRTDIKEKTIQTDKNVVAQSVKFFLFY